MGFDRERHEEPMRLATPTCAECGEFPTICLDTKDGKPYFACHKCFILSPHVTIEGKKFTLVEIP